MATLSGSTSSSNAPVLSSMSPQKLGIPTSHPLWQVRGLADQALDRLNPTFSRLCPRGGRPSIPPEQLLLALLLQAIYGIHSERMTKPAPPLAMPTAAIPPGSAAGCGLRCLQLLRCFAGPEPLSGHRTAGQRLWRNRGERTLLGLQPPPHPPASALLGPSDP